MRLITSLTARGGCRCTQVRGRCGTEDVLCRDCHIKHELNTCLRFFLNSVINGWVRNQLNKVKKN